MIIFRTDVDYVEANNHIQSLLKGLFSCDGGWDTKYSKAEKVLFELSFSNISTDPVVKNMLKIIRFRSDECSNYDQGWYSLLTGLQTMEMYIRRCAEVSITEDNQRIKYFKG